jgi:succinate dehydrogenase hydrophobic anchor subunit
MMPEFLEKFIEIFKLAPAIAALLMVIWLMYKIILKKDETLKAVAEQSKEDTVRWTKMMTLLEILVNRGDRRDK